MMSTLPYRNRNGRVVKMPSYAATDAKNSFGKLMRSVSRRGAIAITNRNEPEAVLLSVDEYQSLVAASRHVLEEIVAEFDAIIEQMQSSEAKRGVECAFDAVPSTLDGVVMRNARKQG